MIAWQRGVVFSLLMLFGFQASAENTHLIFRQQIACYIQAIVDKKPALDSESLDLQWNQAYQTAQWSLLTKRYCDGRLVGKAKVQGERLSQVLQTAVQKTLAGFATVHNHCHWEVTFYYPPAQSYTFLDSGERVIGKHLAIERVDAPVLKKQIIDSHAYLMRVMHKDYYGFYKLYDVARHQKQTQLRTIYTASSLYTLLQAERVVPTAHPPFKKIAQFLLNAQINQGIHQGAFYYAYHPRQQHYIPVLVVGTVSKTIFTLLLLNQKYPEDKRYLQAAILAGDWLVRQVNSDGTVISKWVYQNHHWVPHHKQSALYSGQVLSALSRLYGVTHDVRYLKVASMLVKRFQAQLDKSLLLQDDYRPANSISSSWALMSLIDYAKVAPDAKLNARIAQLAQFLVVRQNQSTDDLYDYGRYWDAMTPSGNGWINEVMGQAYHFCQANPLKSCLAYRQAMSRTSRWLIQNAYSEVNTYALKSPDHAIGGYMTSDKVNTIRTDAVCHGLNSMIDLYLMVGERKTPLLVLDEQPFEAILPRLRMG